MPMDEITQASVEEQSEKFDHYNILVTPSSELFKQTLVVMMSAILNCKLPCNFYIMQCTWTDEQKKECRKFISNYPNFNVEFITVNEDDFKDFTPWKGKYGTYYKLLSHVYLPESVDRILYLDCDSFINKDIYDYYSMDFEDNYLIGSTEALSLEIYNRFRQQGLEKHGYMNGGVVLFNIKKFKKDCITKETYLNALSEFDGSYLADQGIVSYVFDGKIKLLPSYKYNHLMFQEGTVNQTYTYKRIFSTPFQERTKLFTKEYWNEEFDEEHEATIVHFAGYFVVKPWCVKIKIQEDGNIKVVDIPYLEKTHLSHQVVDRFYMGWWNIAKNLPKLNFEQLMREAESFVDNVQIKNLNSRMQYILNALDFCSELCCDIYGQKRFERYLKSLSGKNIAMLKQQDRVSKVFKAAADMYKAQIVFSSDKGMLSNLTEEELAECQKADVVITCCVHGTKTHERDGVKCIDIWDILRDDSYTADLPLLKTADSTPDDLKAFSEQNAQLIKLISEYHTDLIQFKQLTQKIDDLQTDKDKLNVEIGKVSCENDHLKERLSQSYDQYQELNKSYNVLQTKMKETQADDERLRSEMASVRSSAEQAKISVAEANQEIERLKHKISEMQSTRSWRYTRIFRKNKKDEEI